MRTYTEQEMQGKRLREARELKFESATDAWNAIKRNVKISLQTYIQHENGTRGYKARATDYAKALGTTAQWLLWGEEKRTEAFDIPVTGKVAAGANGHFQSDYVAGDSGEFIQFNPDEITLALEIDGDSMLPRYRNGDKVLFGYQHDDPTPFVRREVMAQLKDGRKLFKVLRKGSSAGLWDLYSINPDHDPIRDVELDWVFPVKWVAV